MSLLQNIITQIAKNALSDNDDRHDGRYNDKDNRRHHSNRHPQDGLGGLLGGVLGGQNDKQANFGLDDILGSVLGNKRHTQKNASSGQDSLGGLLGSVLGGRSNMPAGDLGSVLGGLLQGGLGNKTANRGLNKNALLLALLPLVLNYIHNNGGLAGILHKFNQSGLQQKAQSFVNIGDNDGLDEDEVQTIFGRDEIAQMSQKIGASEADVRLGLGELLPQLVNDLTPHGSVADDEKDANWEISEILRQFKGNA